MLCLSKNLFCLGIREGRFAPLSAVHTLAISSSNLLVGKMVGMMVHKMVGSIVLVGKMVGST